MVGMQAWDAVHQPFLVVLQPASWRVDRRQRRACGASSHCRLTVWARRHVQLPAAEADELGLCTGLSRFVAHRLLLCHSERKQCGEHECGSASGGCLRGHAGPCNQRRDRLLVAH